MILLLCVMMNVYICARSAGMLTVPENLLRYASLRQDLSY